MARLKPQNFLSPQSSAAFPHLSAFNLLSLSTQKKEKKNWAAMVTEHRAQPLFDTRPTYLTSAAYLLRPSAISLCFQSSLFLYAKEKDPTGRP